MVGGRGGGEVGGVGELFLFLFKQTEFCFEKEITVD